LANAPTVVTVPNKYIGGAGACIRVIDVGSELYVVRCRVPTSFGAWAPFSAPGSVVTVIQVDEESPGDPFGATTMHAWSEGSIDQPQ
jgi:hypothetical protein